MKTLLATTAITLLASGPLLAQDALPEASPPPEGMQTQEMQQQEAPPAVTPTEGMQAETAPDAAPGAATDAADPAPMQAQDAPAAPDMAEPESMQAQDTPAAPDTTLAEGTGPDTGADTLFLAPGEALYASDLIGLNVHSSETDYGVYGTDPVAEADRSQWDAIGEINDIVVTRDGRTAGVLVDVGGFLGIGSKPVLLSVDQLNLMRDENGNVHGVTAWTKEQLKEMPAHRH